MKKKALNYLLGVLVVIVWGGAAYRILGAMEPEEEEEIPAGPPVSTGPAEDFAVKKDTVALNLNYPDPFGITRSKAPDTTVRNNPKNKVSHNTRVAITDWPNVRYTGFIANPNTKKIISILNVDGKNLMLADGEAQDGLLVIRNRRDSVRIRYKNSTKFITRNNGQ